MESACQIKGSKVNNRKQAKHDVHNGSRALIKDHTTTSTTNSLNGSDEENQEDNGAARHNNNNNNAKKNTKNNSNSSNSTPTSTTPVAVVNGNGNSNHKANKPAISSGNTDNNNKINKEKVSYNKVVSNGIATTTTTSTADLPYNKVVSNGIATTTTTTTIPDLAYNKLVSNGLTTTTTTTTTAPELAYNKVVSNGIATTNEIGYTKVTPNYVSYSKIVNGNDDKTKTTINDTSTIANTNVANESNDAVNKENTNGVNNNNNNHENKSKTKPSEAQAQQRRAVLSYEQVCRLSDVMNEVVCIHGRGNFPTLEVRLRDLVKVVKAKLEADPSSGGAGMKVRDIRLNGGAASHVLATESQPYNDLDLIFGVELSSSRNYDKVKAAVLGSLFDLLPEGVSRKRITTCSLKEAYVSKMVKVNNDGDRWSLISLGNSRGHRNVELKFVDTMRRQFEFSVDSFQIVLDSLLLWHESCKQPISECLYPNVVGESVYGDFHEALYHLQKKLISTRHPEEIRGGGLLKYCNLLVKMYKAAQPDYIKTLERYMCSRFFIDFPDIGQQKAKLENYLWNHFVGPEEESLKYQYLIYLHNVVEESTVCLMGHERRQTLALIQSLAYQVLCQDQHRLNTHHSPAPAYLFANGYYYAPVIPTACYPCTCSTWMACSS